MADEKDDSKKSTEDTATTPQPDAGEVGSESSGAEEAAAAVEEHDDTAAGTASPADIQSRLDKLAPAGDSEDESLARAEAELAERRANPARKKRGLEASASKKLDKIGTKPKKKRELAAAAAAEAEAKRAPARPTQDAFQRRTISLGEWIKENAKLVGAVAGGLLIGGAAYLGYTSYVSSRNADASVLLTAAVTAENGRIGDPKDTKAVDPQTGMIDSRPVFVDANARRDAALAKYREVRERYSGTGAAYLARLGEASLLLDARDAEGALNAYEEVKRSPLAAADNEVKGRALEGMGFAFEAQNKLDEADKAFRELENTVEVTGFKELAIFHQGRVAEAKGDKDKAKELFKTVRDRLRDGTTEQSFPYLKEVVDERLRVLDPSLVPPPMSVSGRPGQEMPSSMSEAQQKAMQEQLMKQIEELQRRAAEEKAGGGPTQGAPAPQGGSAGDPPAPQQEAP